VSKINNLRLSKANRNLFNSKPYKTLRKVIIIIYVLFIIVYMLRENLYKLDNKYITLFAGTSPNLIPSSLFTLIGIFYIVPFLKGIDSINKTMCIWLVNALNIIVFSLIEYLHVVFKLGVWDNNDMIASLIGILVSTAIYFNIRKKFLRIDG
jgi:hypothetical protein